MKNNIPKQQDDDEPAPVSINPREWLKSWQLTEKVIRKAKRKARRQSVTRG